MTGSTLHSPAHGTVSLKLCREQFRFESALVRRRAHRDITIGVNSTNALNPACIQSASYLPTTAVGRWDRAIERTNSLVALAVRPFIQQGTYAGYAICAGPLTPPASVSRFARCSNLSRSRAASLASCSVHFIPPNLFVSA
jgi:hypothetical protein